jgi:hypothetical protein
MSTSSAPTPLHPTFEIPGGLKLEIIELDPAVDVFIYRITCAGTTDAGVAREIALFDQVLVDHAARYGIAEFTHQLRALLERLEDPTYNEALR